MTPNPVNKMNAPSHPTQSTSRREFIKASSAAAVGSVLGANLSFPAKSLAAAGNTLKIGLIGCGGRGNGAAADALAADSNTTLHAMGDIDPAKIELGLREVAKSVTDQTRIQVPAERRFVGLDAYEKVIASGVDVVLLTTPPGFRPQHFQAAVAAGKHAFLEKPVATDAAGIRSVRANAVAAKRNGLAVQSGFCWRANTSRIEFFKRLHDGAIGEVRSLYHTYLTGPVKPMRPVSERPSGMGDVEWQIRNWYNFVWLCGDGLVEQAIHSIDKMFWAMKDVPPLKCTAVGGRQTPNQEGNIYDHIEVNYEWANGVRGFMAQRQIAGCHSETKDYITATKGIGLLGGRRGAEFSGETTWHYEGPENESQMFGSMYQNEHKSFLRSIRDAKPLNDGEHMCNCTLMAIMGRMAAYTGQEITWEQAMNSQERLVPERLDWNMKLAAPPMATPGVTKLA
jgi:myo-inositol 2-dehydrogenase / D-chiro-inositol 1-dehydrogenase